MKNKIKSSLFGALAVTVFVAFSASSFAQNTQPNQTKPVAKTTSTTTTTPKQTAPVTTAKTHLTDKKSVTPKKTEMVKTTEKKTMTPRTVESKTINTNNENAASKK